MVDIADFKESMSRFPSGVVVVTTKDEKGKSWGFTASSFSSLSMDPPLILVCLGRAAESYPAFSAAQWFAINILGSDDEVVALQFATRGADKFAGDTFDYDEHGSALLPSAISTLTCRKHDVFPGGDHDIIVGRVMGVRLRSYDTAMVYAARRFGQFLPAGARPNAPISRVGMFSASSTRPRVESDTIGSHRNSLSIAEVVIKHCVRCGADVARILPTGDQIRRHICNQCGHIHYVNPRIIVGCVIAADDGSILMCKRRIKPRQNCWTFPSGFMECGESGDEGARREAYEETQADVTIEGLLCVIDVPQINQVHLIYRGRMNSSILGPTEESSEVVLMAEEDVPWEKLAFTSIGESLRCYFEDRRHNRRQVHMLDLRAAPYEKNSDKKECVSRVAPEN